MSYRRGKAVESAEAAAQEKRTKDMQVQQLEQDKLRAEQAPESNSTAVPVVVPRPVLIPRGAAIHSDGRQIRNPKQPKFNVRRQESSSRLTDPENRDPSRLRPNPGGVEIQIK